MIRGSRPLAQINKVRARCILNLFRIAFGPHFCVSPGSSASLGAAHSTHLRGQGTWDAEHGERNRVTVTLATGIPEDVVRSANLNYLDPAAVDVAAYEADPDTFVEPHGACSD